MEQQIIGIAGLKGSGKDTAAQALITKYGFKRAAFADPLKELVAEAFGLDLYSLHDPVQKELRFTDPFTPNQAQIDNFIYVIESHENLSLTVDQEVNVRKSFFGITFDSPRHLLQYVGTDVVRKNIKDSFWIDAFKHSIAAWPKVVVTDMRFPNERAYIKSRGGKLLLIKRGQSIGSGHISETSLGQDTEYDVVLQNNGSVSDLHSKVTDLFSEYRQHVLRTANADHETIVNRIAEYPQRTMLLNSALGLAGEVGEYVDAVKKLLMQGKVMDTNKAILELGDINYYLELAAYSLDVTMDEVRAKNVEKLQRRYPNGFTTEDSIKRADENDKVSGAW